MDEEFIPVKKSLVSNAATVLGQIGVSLGRIVNNWTSSGLPEGERIVAELWSRAGEPSRDGDEIVREQLTLMIRS